MVGHVASSWYLPYFGNSECWELGYLLPSRCIVLTGQKIGLIGPCLRSYHPWHTYEHFLLWAFLSSSSVPPYHVCFWAPEWLQSDYVVLAPVLPVILEQVYETSLSQSFLNHKSRLRVTSLGVVRNECPRKAFNTVPGTCRAHDESCLLPWWFCPRSIASFSLSCFSCL